MAWHDEICDVCGKKRDQCEEVAPWGEVYGGHVQFKHVTPRLQQIMEHIKLHGEAKSWNDLEVLNLTEEDFQKNDNLPFLSVGNAGAIYIHMLAHVAGGFRNDHEHHWGVRPSLTVGHFEYKDCPEWLQVYFREWWKLVDEAMIADEAFKESSTDRCGPFAA